MLIDYDANITIDSSEILDEMSVQDIEEYMEDNGIGYYYLYDEDDVKDQIKALARFMNGILTDKENTKKLIDNLISMLDSDVLELLKNELNRKSKK